MADSGEPFGPAEAIIISGPEFYSAHITRLYGGYKRTRNLYGRATYQKDPDQGAAGLWEAYIYWSAVDSRFCVGPQLGAAIGDAVTMPKATSSSPKISAPFENTCAVLMYEVAPDDTVIAPSMLSRWAVNLYGSGPRYQVDHMATVESLRLPAEAADPARETGGYMHICSRKYVDYEFPPKRSSLVGDMPLLRAPNPDRPYAEAATWVRASVFCGQDKGPLLDASTEPRGDWLESVRPQRTGLLPVFAAVREYPGCLEQLLADNLAANAEGRYCVWLFDVWESRWLCAHIDDYVPVVRNEAGSLVPWLGGHDRTLWALLLEKALAKWCGSYDVLRRAARGPLLMVLTGQHRQLRAGR